MALASSTVAALAVAAAAAGANAYNTQRTARRQDSQMAESIRNQSRHQQKIDARTSEEIGKLEQSRSADEAAAGREAYGQQLRRNAALMSGGLTPGVGSETFQKDAAQGVGEVTGYANDTAGLMARMDAPGMQRRGEGYGFQRMQTDNALVGREASGQAYLDELRLRSIRRNPWIDAASQLGMGYASGMAGGAFGAGSGASTGAALNANAVRQGGMANGYYVPPTWG